MIDSNKSGSKHSDVVGASVGAGLGLLFLCYVAYRVRDHIESDKQREGRKDEYFKKQAALVDASRAEWAAYAERERVVEDERKEKRRRKAAAKSAEGIQSGAYFNTETAYSARSLPGSSRASSSAYNMSNLSSLHSSELHSRDHSQSNLHTNEQGSEHSSSRSSGDIHSSQYSAFLADMVDSDGSGSSSDGDGEY